jgi:hypothetical protein
MITAEDILTSKVFEASVDNIKLDLWEEFERLAPTDKEQLQVIALKNWALREFIGELERRMTSGAESRINRRKV